MIVVCWLSRSQGNPLGRKARHLVRVRTQRAISGIAGYCWIAAGVSPFCDVLAELRPRSAMSASSEVTTVLLSASPSHGETRTFAPPAVMTRAQGMEGVRPPAVVRRWSFDGDQAPAKARLTCSTDLPAQRGLPAAATLTRGTFLLIGGPLPRCRTLTTYQMAGFTRETTASSRQSSGRTSPLPCEGKPFVRHTAAMLFATLLARCYASRSKQACIKSSIPNHRR